MRVAMQIVVDWKGMAHGIHQKSIGTPKHGKARVSWEFSVEGSSLCPLEMEAIASDGNETRWTKRAESPRQQRGRLPSFTGPDSNRPR